MTIGVPTSGGLGSERGCNETGWLTRDVVLLAPKGCGQSRLTTNTGRCRLSSTFGGVPPVPTDGASQVNERDAMSGDLSVIGPARWALSARRRRALISRRLRHRRDGRPAMDIERSFGARLPRVHQPTVRTLRHLRG